MFYCNDLFLHSIFIKEGGGLAFQAPSIVRLRTSVSNSWMGRQHRRDRAVRSSLVRGWNGREVWRGVACFLGHTTQTSRSERVCIPKTRNKPRRQRQPGDMTIQLSTRRAVVGAKPTRDRAHFFSPVFPDTCLRGDIPRHRASLGLARRVLLGLRYRFMDRRWSRLPISR